MTRPAFRFAPSPNGELHLGHAYSALLNWQMAQDADGRFLVRIEDIDTVRCTAELATRALADLAWLGLTWEEPIRYQSRHFDDYRARQRQLEDMGLLYPCFCSRREIAARNNSPGLDPEGQPLYSGACRDLPPSEISRRVSDGEARALRLDMSRALTMVKGDLYFVEKGGSVKLDPAAWGDVVLVRKDIGTSYHIAVVTDDALQGISHVVRGRDLYYASAIHRLLQDLLSLPVPQYHHHDLVSDETGRKLSKSAGDTSLRALRESGIGAAEVRRSLGFV